VRFSEESGVSAAPTYYARIYVGGDLANIKQVCREYCMGHGLCVTVDPTTFIYTAGEETGAVVGLINYPRFHFTLEKILEHAQTLAGALMVACCQRSCSIQTPDQTYYQSRRVAADAAGGASA